MQNLFGPLPMDAKSTSLLAAHILKVVRETETVRVRVLFLYESPPPSHDKGRGVGIARFTVCFQYICLCTVPVNIAEGGTKKRAALCFCCAAPAPHDQAFKNSNALLDKWRSAPGGGVPRAPDEGARKFVPHAPHFFRRSVVEALERRAPSEFQARRPHQFLALAPAQKGTRLTFLYG